jgi:hypothetical protein
MLAACHMCLALAAVIVYIILGAGVQRYRHRKGMSADWLSSQVSRLQKALLICV